jgi:hypothetical protein
MLGLSGGTPGPDFYFYFIFQTQFLYASQPVWLHTGLYWSQFSLLNNQVLPIQTCMMPYRSLAVKISRLKKIISAGGPPTGQAFWELLYEGPKNMKDLKHTCKDSTFTPTEVGKC